MLGAAAALSAVVAIFVYDTAKSHYLKTGEASARAIVSAVDKTLAIGIYARDEVLLKELVEGLSRHPSVARVAIGDDSGHMLASSTAGVAAGAASAVAADAAAPSFESALHSPFNATEPVGRLQVWLDSARLSAEAKRQAATLVGALIVLLVAVLAVFNTLARRLLSRPMHRLAEELALIEPGTARRLPLDAQHEHDEVGVVTAAANRLLELQQLALERERAMREEIATMEARYRGIFDATSAGIFILSSEGALLQANPALGRLLGNRDGRVDPSCHPDFSNKVFGDPAQLHQLVARARASAQPESGDLEMVRSDASTLWVHCMVSAVTDTQDIDYRVEGVLYDITQRRLQERSAQHRAEHDALTGLKSRAFIESSLDRSLSAAQRHDEAVTLMFIDLDGFKAVNDRWGHAAGDAVLVEAAQRLRTLFKRSCDVVGRLGGDELVVMITGVDAMHPSVSQRAALLIKRFKEPFALPNGEVAMVGASVGVASYPLHATSAATLIQAADAAMYAVKQSGKGRFVIAVTGESSAGDTSLVPSPQTINTATAMRDPLTGLPDRRQLGECLARAHARAIAHGTVAAVICLDIDQFKSVNVAHGPRVGDEVLCEVARRLGSALRREDAVVRTGSDEFVAVVLGEERSRVEAARAAEIIARKLLGVLAEPIAASSGVLTVRVSAGVSLMETGSTDALDVLREAQLALRRSKSTGRGSLVVFESGMMAGFHEQLMLEKDLRAAIGTGQFSLHVQPQVDRAGSVIGGEALLRWQHPQRGLVPPDQFIPIAESSGAIVELGNWVLHAGCEILARMRRAGALQTLSINISPAQFSHPDFVSQVRDALESCRAPADGLILEITENLLISDITQVRSRLDELVAIGLRFSIDDFGTGFSSLSYLRQLPLYEIKIDRSFIGNLPHDAASAGIVRSILSMGSHLDLNVVAEGVETREQSQFLLTHGCAVQQGWLHGRPAPAEDFLRDSCDVERASATAPLAQSAAG